jgi:2-amino-4-hydroxy-6-hydroxymethyldihydropteridine diphosphokinase
MTLFVNHAVVAYLGLGSNLANPIAQLQQAEQAIVAVSGIHWLACSSLYHSAPLGPADQPDYINSVLAIASTLSPSDLLAALQAIELAQGRQRNGERWGARTLDIDILLYGKQVINLPDLTVPHTELSRRAFVLYPLAELAPQLIIPTHGRLARLLARCSLTGLERLTT